MKDPKVYIIVLNWNGWQDTIECLESLQKLTYPNYQVIVVDNGSEDDSWKQLQGWKNQKNDGSILIRNSENLGFSGGSNVGITYALQHQAEYVFLLNNDARVEPDTLNHLVTVSLSADAAIVGSRVLSENGKQILFSGRTWPAHLFGFDRLKKSESDQSFWLSSSVDGCSILLKRDILELRYAEYGYFLDPKFFMYCEETDLCLYGISHGYRCAVARDAVVYHGLAKTSGGFGNPRSYYYLTRNRIFMADRWLNLPVKILFHFYYIPSRLAIQLFHICHGRTNSANAVLNGLFDGYMNIIGKWSKH